MNSSPSFGAATAAAYRRDAVLTDSPLRLVVRIFAGAIVALERSRRGVERGDLVSARREHARARALVCELLAALDDERGGEIATRLRGLYDYLLADLLRFESKPNPARLHDAEEILKTLKDGFDVLVRNGAEREVGG